MLYSSIFHKKEVRKLIFIPLPLIKLLSFTPVAFHFFHKEIVTFGLRGFGHRPGRPVWGIICPLFQLFIRGVRFLTVLFLGLARFFYHLTLLGRIGRGLCGGGRGLRVGGLLRAAKRITAYRTPGFILNLRIITPQWVFFPMEAANILHGKVADSFPSTA